MDRLRFLAVVPAWIAIVSITCRPGSPNGVGRFEAAPGAPPRAVEDATTALIDREWGFRIDHPVSFVVRTRKRSELAGLRPSPVASTYIMNPTMAAGELAGIEPPDLELRLFTSAADQPLAAWLAEAGLAPPDLAGASRPFRTGRTPGMEVCQPAPIAPGCSVFFRADTRIFQLTAVSVEGEGMIRSFELFDRESSRPESFYSSPGRKEAVSRD